MLGFLKRQQPVTYARFRTSWASPVPGITHIYFKNLVSAWLVTRELYTKSTVSAPSYRGYADVTGCDSSGKLWAYRCAEQPGELGVEVVEQALQGMRETRAARAGVVSISGYTKQAQELARQEDVRLVVLKE